MSIPFFSPIYPSSDPNVVDNCGFLRFTTHFFNLDGTVRPYKITCYTQDKSGLEFISGIKRSTTMGSFLVKFFLLYTIVVPLIMFIGLAIYRAMNRFESGPNRLESLPEELYQTIIRLSGPDSMRLAATSKENHQLVNKDPWYQKNSAILNKGIKIFKSFYQPSRVENVFSCIQTQDKRLKSRIDSIVKGKGEFYTDFYKSVANLDIEDAIQAIRKDVWNMGWENKLYVLNMLSIWVVKEKLRGAEALTLLAEDLIGCNMHTDSSALTIYPFLEADCLGMIAALTDTSKALEIAEFLHLNDHEPQASSIRQHVIGVLALTDPEKAFEMVDLLRDFDKSYGLEPVAEGFAVLNPDRGLNILNSLKDELQKYNFLVSFFGTLAKADLDKSLTWANALERPIDQIRAKRAIMEAIKTYSIEKALELSQGLNEGLGEILPELALSDPERAIALANGIEKIDDSQEVLALIAEALAPSDPEKALLVAKSIEDKRVRAKALVSIAFKG